MWVSLLLISGFFIWALLIWRSAPALISEKEVESEAFRYTYTTTPVRSTAVRIGSCLLFALIMWLIAYAVTYLLWRELVGPLFAEDSLGYYVLLLAVVVAIVLLSRLPKTQRFLVEVCVFCQRCQFFPMLPSPKEEDLMAQIAKLPVGTLPEEIEAALSKDPQSPREFHFQEIYDQYRRLEVLYRELQSLAKQRKGVIRRFYFGKDWELIDSQFQAIEQQMHSNSSDADEVLGKKIQACLYYCYGLLTRVIMETTTSMEESRALFQYYGFDVKMSE